MLLVPSFQFFILTIIHNYSKVWPKNVSDCLIVHHDIVTERFSVLDILFVMIRFHRRPNRHLLHLFSLHRHKNTLFEKLYDESLFQKKNTHNTNE